MNTANFIAYWFLASVGHFYKALNKNGRAQKSFSKDNLIFLTIQIPE